MNNMISNRAVTVEVLVRENDYRYELDFQSHEEARRVLKGLEKRQLLLRSGAVINIEEDVEYDVKPAVTLN